MRFGRCDYLADRESNCKTRVNALVMSTGDQTCMPQRCMSECVSYLSARRASPTLDSSANAQMDVVFTVEYSIRSAQTAVYTLLGLNRTPPPVYKGQFNPRILLNAFLTLHDKNV